MRLPPIDSLSFWLGFLAASLFWWLINRFTRNVPAAVMAFIKSKREEARERRMAGVGIYVRQDALRRAQRAHLAHNLFALDEVLVPPRLLAPPSYMVHPEKQVYGNTIASYILPYLPDWPEIAAQFPAETITAAQALQKGANIVVIGQPGTGKTTCLAQLASQLARRDPDLGRIADHVPVWVHALDLDVSEVGLAAPAMFLVRLVSGRLSTLSSPRLPAFLNQSLKEGKLILIVDGLDELPPNRFQPTCRFINALLAQFPRIQVITSGVPEYLDGLLLAGFVPLGIAGWNVQQRSMLIERWISAWQQSALPEIQKKTSAETVDSILVENWLAHETVNLSPLEWTLKIWAVLAGDVRGPSPADGLMAYLDRYNAKGLPIQGLQAFAAELIGSERAEMSFSDLEKFLNRYKITDEILEEPLPGIEEPGDKEPERKAKKVRGKKISSAGRAIERLIQSGVLVEYNNEQIAFAHPFLAGFLGAGAFSPTRVLELEGIEKWAVGSAGLRFLAAQNKITSWILQGLNSDCGPLYQRLLNSARWLSTAPTADWRSAIMRQLVTMLHQEDLPAIVRARVVAALVSTQDASLPLLFKQLFGSNSAAVRQLAALASGSIRDGRAMDDLIGMFADPAPEVSLAACLAVGAIQTPASIQALSETMMRADESLRQASAETLAADPQNGYPLLQTAIANPDLLTRRAGVYGLARIREEWSVAILNKIAVEDSQWVVRNAASQIIEELNQPLSPVPERLQPAHKSGWLISFAGKDGVGIPAGDPAVEILAKALQSGNENERLGALNYLKDHPDESIMALIYQELYQNSGLIQEAAAYSLWYMFAGGAKLPAPQKFGL